jgi:hypothetical protein
LNSPAANKKVAHHGDKLASCLTADKKLFIKN